MSKYCVDCDTEISRKATRCRTCAYIARSRSAQWRRSLSIAAKRRCEDPGYCQQLSERAKQQWADGVFGSEDWKQKVGDAVRARWAKKDYQEHMRRVLEERWQDPQYQAKVTQGVQEFWTPEQRAAWGKRYTGENNPNWRGGSSFEPYPAVFNQALKASIRKRDGHTCKLCTASENGAAHDVHHIDYDKGNNDLCNLITLCHMCHPYTNGNRECWQNHFEQLLETI